MMIQTIGANLSPRVTVGSKQNKSHNCLQALESKSWKADLEGERVDIWKEEVRNTEWLQLFCPTYSSSESSRHWATGILCSDELSCRKSKVCLSLNKTEQNSGKAQMLGKKEAIPEKAKTGALSSWHQPVPWLVMNHALAGQTPNCPDGNKRTQLRFELLPWDIFAD